MGHGALNSEAGSKRKRLSDPIDGSRSQKSRRELLHRDPLVQCMLGIEQQRHRPFLVEPDVDGAHFADLELVGNGGNRAIVGLEHTKTDGDIVG